MQHYPVIIIGAGVAGLTCAIYLKQKSIPFVLLESSDEVGGRVRTDRVDGFLLDRGFQIFLTSYPEAKRVLNYEALQLKAFRSGYNSSGQPLHTAG
jgi:phytoene dehydrogenase-like protein